MIHRPHDRTLTLRYDEIEELLADAYCAGSCAEWPWKNAFTEGQTLARREALGYGRQKRQEIADQCAEGG